MGEAPSAEASLASHLARRVDPCDPYTGGRQALCPVHPCCQTGRPAPETENRAGESLGVLSIAHRHPGSRRATGGSSAPRQKSNGHRPAATRVRAPWEARAMLSLCPWTSCHLSSGCGCFPWTRCDCDTRVSGRPAVRALARATCSGRRCQSSSGQSVGSENVSLETETFRALERPTLVLVAGMQTAQGPKRRIRMSVISAASRCDDPCGGQSWPRRHRQTRSPSRSPAGPFAPSPVGQPSWPALHRRRRSSSETRQECR